MGLLTDNVCLIKGESTKASNASKGSYKGVSEYLNVLQTFYVDYPKWPMQCGYGSGNHGQASGGEGRMNNKITLRSLVWVTGLCLFLSALLYCHNDLNKVHEPGRV